MDRQAMFQSVWSRDHWESLREALCQVQRGGFVTQAQRDYVRETARAAGRQIGTPELCVVAFKWLLAEVANEACIPLGRERTDLLERFISVFIEEMYRVDADGAAENGCRSHSTDGVSPPGSFAPPAVRP